MLQDLFSLKGRISRLEYFLTVVMVSIYFLTIRRLLDYSQVMMIIAMIPALLYLIVQSIKRSHDMGISPWWLLVPLYFLFLIVSEGQSGHNPFGPEPRRIQYANGGDGDADFVDSGDSHCGDHGGGDCGGDGGGD